VIVVIEGKLVAVPKPDEPLYVCSLSCVARIAICTVQLSLLLKYSYTHSAASLRPQESTTAATPTATTAPDTQLTPAKPSTEWLVNELRICLRSGRMV